MGDNGTWPDGCGSGRWCESCRQEIREEALRWIRELNVLPAEAQGWADVSSAILISTRWHRRWLLTQPSR